MLCGGLGTRLREALPDKPKALAEVSGRPFLDILVDELKRQGLRRFVFCVGYGAEHIISRYGSRNDALFRFSKEDRPLGTGGALQHALQLIQSDPFIVVNGDSFCAVPLLKVLSRHHDNDALLTIVAVRPSGRMDAGMIRADAENRIIEFNEKSGAPDASGGYVNAGIYAVGESARPYFAKAPPFSLEHDVFPAMIASGRCFIFPVPGPLVDIGTPERLRAAGELLR